jgi:hypothetical protein
MITKRHIVFLLICMLVMARYVRILGLGNASANNWNSYTEVRINWFSETAISNFSDETALEIYPVPAVQGMHIIYPAWRETTRIIPMTGRMVATRIVILND